jgi:hypothetical protein
VQFSDDRKWHPAKLKNRQVQVASPIGILSRLSVTKSTVFEVRIRSPRMFPYLRTIAMGRPLVVVLPPPIILMRRRNFDVTAQSRIFAGGFSISGK